MRYIDADALKEQCFKFANDVSRSAMAFVQGQINAAPTADVVEVVRCKDCKHFTEGMIGDDLKYFCKLTSGMVYPAPDFYCSYGERREENEG